MLEDSYTRDQYNKIADAYQSYNEGPYVKEYVEYSYLKYIKQAIEEKGDKELKVLELACGNGTHSRLIKKMFPNIKVLIGVDISDSQIMLAKSIEEKEKLGIEYIRKDAIHLTGYDNYFDIVISAYLLCYSESVEKMKSFCNVIYKCLKPNSKYLTINPNTFLSPKDVYRKLNKYGVSCVWEPSSTNLTGKAQDGDTYHACLWNPANDKLKAEFTSHYMTAKSYEHCFKEAGFSKYSWNDCEVDPKHLSLNREFWKTLVETEPSVYVIVLEK